jgi:NAD+ synthase (glutamine-hydrolysing)
LRSLYGHREQDLGSDELAELGFDSAIVQDVIRMTDTAEYKRRRYPPGTKITRKAVGRDRRLPITNQWQERLVN